MKEYIVGQTCRGGGYYYGTEEMARREMWRYPGSVVFERDEENHPGELRPITPVPKGRCVSCKTLATCDTEWAMKAMGVDGYANSGGFALLSDFKVELNAPLSMEALERLRYRLTSSTVEEKAEPVPAPKDKKTSKPRPDAKPKIDPPKPGRLGYEVDDMTFWTSGE